MTEGSSIVTQIFALSTILSLLWGVNLLAAAVEYRQSMKKSERRREEVVRALRRLVTALCIWALMFSYVFRTFMVLGGLDEVAVGQIIFYALISTSLVGAIFCIVSLRYD